MRNSIFVTFRDTINKFNLDNSILNDLPNAHLYGPSNSAKVSFKKKPLAVIDLNKWSKKLDLKCKTKTNCNITKSKKLDNGILLEDSEKNKYFGKIVVDCSGNSQVLSKKMGKETSSIYYECYGFIMDDCNIADNKTGILNGDFNYTNAGGWLYPISKTKCQIGIGDFVPYKTGYKKSIKERAEEMIKNCEPYKRWLKEGKIISTFYKKAPMIMPLHHMVQDNLVLLGDAGGQSTPFLGEGIRPAFEMASDVAKVLKKSFDKDNFSRDSLKEIEREWLKKFGNSYLWSIIIRHIWAYEFTNEDIDELVSNLESLPNKDFYKFLRSDIHIDLLLEILDFKIVDDTIVNFFKNHISYFNSFNEKRKKTQLPSTIKKIKKNNL